MLTLRQCSYTLMLWMSTGLIGSWAITARGKKSESEFAIPYHKPQIAAVNLTGTWMMSRVTHTTVRKISRTETIQEDEAIVCNVCPEITFKADGTGHVKLADGSGQLLGWQVRGSILIISNRAVANQKKVNPLALNDGRYRVVTRDRTNVKLIDSTGWTQWLISLD